ncbi:MAG: NAD(P)/FAD-dependent oxidoreductase [Methanobrevibacter sp.]|uniref:geranylgeranyl reductase family protein n=1 Tax=Methanobrevibacter sp. TaxID=66852 RepID=UPI0025D8FC9E|nr:NAD(P)/FAD-dependent oxidoreductase [Methanobrevibacter sp.]MBQ8018271.1 NAD(P)/FAD-dependent oxidoreductase [Methanobrevibacter sp.]
MSFDFDVVVVGAGPVGSTIAYYLTNQGLNIAIIDKKRQIGYPLQCAGILSKHIFDNNHLPDEVILNNVKGAFLHSKNHILKVEKDTTQAYIIDRISYDEFLLNRAIQNGVKFINQKVIDVDSDEALTYLSNSHVIKSKIVIGCDGYNSILSKSIGNNQNSFPASQMLVKIAESNMQSFRNAKSKTEDYVDTYLLEDVLPGFLWVIPLKNDLYRIGLFSNQTHKRQDEVIINFLNQNFEYEIVEKYKGFIPIFDEKSQMVNGRLVLIGDAAGQIKPTSGGGLLVAFDACDMACKYIVEAIDKSDMGILRGYEKEFKAKYLKEFNYQYKVQKTLNLLSDNDIDYLFLKLKENNGEEIISQYGDMDTQSKLVKEFIKRGLIFKIVPTFLFKKVINIFGFR